MPADKNKAVFLDRDGTIMVDVGYAHDPDQVQLLAGVGPALVEFKKRGFLLVLVSNQSGIGRGMITQDEADRVHRRLEELLAKEAVRLDAAYYCPHRPEDACACRKPAVELFLRAAAEWDIDLAASFMVGDKLTDAEAGRNAGCFSILLGQDRQPGRCNFVDFFASNWTEVFQQIALGTPRI